jgi:rhamnulose-1-phosphate aldolase
MIENNDNSSNVFRDIFQNIELMQIMDEIAATAQFLWDRGWAERNAGNFSINITGFFNEIELDRLSSFPLISMPGEFPDLARTMFLLSGTGTRMRNIALNPFEYVCLIYINDSGSVSHIIGGIKDTKIRPTSELTTHLAIQQLLLQRKSVEKVVLHAHVTELIALTQIAEFKTGKAINSLLWSMHPETVLYVPDGVGFVPYTLPGTENIAQATLRELGTHNAIIWEKHGCIAVGKTLPEAFDTLDILAKSAKIYFLCKSTGVEPEGLTPAQLNEIRDKTSL